MEPISLAGLTASLVPIAHELAGATLNFAAHVHDADDTLASFSRELTSLTRILEAAASMLRTPHFSLRPPSPGLSDNAGEDVRRALHAALDDIKHFLRRLQHHVRRIQGTSCNRSTYRRAIRAFALRLRQARVDNLRSTLHALQLNLNAALAMAQLHHRTRETRRHAHAHVDLRPEIHLLSRIVQRLPAAEQRSLRTVADRVLRDAGAAARSSAASDLGAPLDGDTRRRIDEWIERSAVGGGPAGVGYDTPPPSFCSASPPPPYESEARYIRLQTIPEDLDAGDQGRIQDTLEQYASRPPHERAVSPHEQRGSRTRRLRAGRRDTHRAGSRDRRERADLLPRHADEVDLERRARSSPSSPPERSSAAEFYLSVSKPLLCLLLALLVPACLANIAFCVVHYTSNRMGSAAAQYAWYLLGIVVASLSVLWAPVRVALLLRGWSGGVLRLMEPLLAIPWICLWIFFLRAQGAGAAFGLTVAVCGLLLLVAALLEGRELAAGSEKREGKGKKRRVDASPR